MTLTLTTAWEHDITAPGGTNHLVITIQATDAPPTHRAPIDLAFALDRSGSMCGFNKMPLVQDAVLASLNHLQPTDRVSLVSFDSEVRIEHRLTPLDPAHRGHLERVTRALRPNGSTNLHGGWWEACHQLATGGGTGRIQRTLLLTDGLANVGIINPRQLSDETGALYQRNISTSAIGVGDHFDELLLSAMAESGGGTFQYIAEASELAAFFEQELASLTQVVAARPYLDITFADSAPVELINQFPVERTELGLGVTLRDLAAGERITLVLEVRMAGPAGHQPHLQPTVHLHWTNPETGRTEEIDQPAEHLVIGDASRAVRNEDAAVAAALEHTARDQREAVRLDRAGQFQEARERSRAAYYRLVDIPDTDDVREERLKLNTMMSMPAAPMPENVRKREVHRTHARSRGKL